MVTDGHRRRLTTMSRQEMPKLHQRSCTDESDSIREGLLGEIGEGIKASRN
jgi:hypothetical protein